ncbi:unnamed protein product, partial [Cladocopium goreaui]
AKVITDEADAFAPKISMPHLHWHWFGNHLRAHHSKKELLEREEVYGSWMAAWLFLLLGLALMAACKKRYGSLQGGLEAIRAKFRQLQEATTCNPCDYDAIDDDDFCEELCEEPYFEQNWRTRSGGGNLDRILEKRREKLLMEEKKQEELTNSFTLSNLPTLLKNKKAELFNKSSSKADLETMSPEEMNELLQVQEQAVPRQISYFQCVKPYISLLFYVGYIALCVLVPLSTANLASCDEGLPWEVHMPFFYYFLCLKAWEVAVYSCDDVTVIGDLTPLQYLQTFMTSFVGLADGYTDATAIVIARSCGSPLWRWMALTYVIGVVGCQWLLMGGATLIFDHSGACFYKILHMDTVASCISMKPEDQNALMAWRLVNWVRCLAEDLPQCFFQTLFILTVKKNGIMLLSIAIGACTSIMAVYNAAKRMAGAMGTSWNVLKVKRDMNRAIDSCDIVAFENAAGAAGNLQELHGTVAHGERMLRYLSAKPCRVHIGAPENPGLQTHLDTPQSEEHLYSSRRRTMEEASKAALSRQKRMEALEAPSSSSARRRGVWHEARHVAKVYNSQRRSVEFAITAAQQREERLNALVKAGPGCCHGALPAASLGKGRRADASWWSDKCQSGEMMRMQSQELI